MNTNPLRYDPQLAAMVPRPYQAELIGALTAATDSPVPGARFIVVVATGGGKQMIATDWQANHAFVRGYRVLRVTKDWFLTRQAAADMVARFDGGGLGVIGYVGDGDADKIMDGVPKDPNAPIVYTTVHTAVARLRHEFVNQKFDFIVVDEVHWGEFAGMYAKLAGHFSDATFIGFTATPRVGSDYVRVGKAYDFGTLANAGFLAHPVPHPPIVTKVSWIPVLAPGGADFTQSSLDRLGASDARNKLIVETYEQNAATFGKTIIFACGIGHSEVLGQMLRVKGIRAAAIHSHMVVDERSRVFEAFKESRLDVLVNVAILTHGIDVPDVKTVMLARPTKSDILFSQMIGRGARLAPGKTWFRIVDFEDNVAAHGIAVPKPGGYLGGATWASSYRGPRRTHLDYVPADLAFLPAVSGYEYLVDLGFQPSQAFALTIALDGPAAAFPTQVLAAIQAANVPTSSVPSVSDTRLDRQDWSVVSTPSGCIVESRALSDVTGFLEVADVLATLRAKVQVSTVHALQVHVGWMPDTEPVFRRVLEILAFFEPALLTISRPNVARMLSHRPLRQQLRRMNATDFGAWMNYFRAPQRPLPFFDPRMLLIGLGPEDSVAFVWPDVGLQAMDVLSRVSLSMHVLRAAEELRLLPGDPRRRVHTAPVCRGVRGDIAEMATYLGMREAMREHFLGRRKDAVGGGWLFDPQFAPLARKVADAWARRAA
jgi:superfamily II DNA or RNA helicase